MAGSLQELFADARRATRVPPFGVNHVLAYGQSLSSGWEGAPALSTQPQSDALMLGGSVRPRDESAAHWQPIGSASFQPLRATAQDIGSGALLTPEAEAALAADATLLGETVLEAAVSTWRRRMLITAGAAASARKVLASSCGVGGRSLEALMRGAEPDLFNRLRDCMALGRTTAAATGQSYGVAALLFLQGEANSWGQGTADKAEYKALLRRFIADFRAEAGADTVPVFLHQTGGPYANDMNTVSQAQLEWALEGPGCFMVAPVYPLPATPSGHLYANGYRWLGAQFGKVMHRVLTLGEGWRPLHPLAARCARREVDVTFHVPVPPLCWALPFMETGRIDIPDKGFTVLDGAGPVEIDAVVLTGPHSVRLTLTRPPQGAARLLYADRRHSGRGCLRDSDDEVANDFYTQVAARDGTAAPRIEGLVGRPYPLMNWCVAFDIPINDPGPPEPPGPSARPHSRPPSLLARVLGWLRNGG